MNNLVIIALEHLSHIDVYKLNAFNASQLKQITTSSEKDISANE